MLTRMAAERMLENPGRSATASRIGAEILCSFLDRMEKGYVKAEHGGMINDKPRNHIFESNERRKYRCPTTE